jgi:hypothetical protein
MKAINCKKTLLASSALLAMSGISNFSHAKDGTFNFAFTTVPDVSINQITGLDFGDDLLLASGSTCTMLIDGATNTPGTVDALVDGASVVAQALYGIRSGDCDATGLTSGVIGKYVINGAEGVTVSIVVNPLLTGNGGNFAFSPAGTAVNYNAAAVDTFVDLVPGTSQTAIADIRLHATADVDQGSGTAAFPGQSFLYIGGTLTADTQLTAGTEYTDSSFVIDVTY